MPTYEYRCPKGHAFDLFQRMSDEPGATCPVCGAAAERILSAGAGFIFKGDGFYITDYRSDDYKKAKASDVAGDSSSSSDTSDKGASGSKGGTGDTGGSKSKSKSSSSKDE
ncbi:MAG: zinc ribbon domain-containing protein [Gemmatimonadetes bacterium]|nr:zinc ribbon domain-containing protein [Gemmatimonadota bacterium]